MIEITHEVNGKRMAPHNMADALTKAMVESAAKQIRQRLSHLACPEHHRRARVTLSSRSAKGLEFSVKGCCEKLIEAATRCLQRGLRQRPTRWWSPADVP